MSSQIRDATIPSPILLERCLSRGLGKNGKTLSETEEAPYLLHRLDEGAENVMNLLSEIGVTHINLATSYHCGRYIRPIIAKEGVIYFESLQEFSQRRS
ncbi:MAG: hypothetical protein NDP22_01015 [Crenarchaeota archaeon]|nr:hypothetical protein [Thermoproteota archaeon]